MVLVRAASDVPPGPGMKAVRTWLPGSVVTRTWSPVIRVTVDCAGRGCGRDGGDAAVAVAAPPSVRLRPTRGASQRWGCKGFLLNQADCCRRLVRRDCRKGWRPGGIR